MPELEGFTPSRLVWTGADHLPPAQVAALIGPGAPFEMVAETIRGHDRLVFARQPRSLRAMFDQTAARQPDADFMVDADRTWTVRETVAEIEAISRVLRERYGIRPGDRVAIVAANSPEHGLAMWAAISVGAVVSGLNGWWTGPELRHGIELTEPSIVLGDERRLARLVDVPSTAPVVTLAALHAEAVALGAGGRSWASEAEPDDPAVILFTSGTTGRPKGATLSHRNIVHFCWANLLIAAIGAAAAPPADPGAPPQRPASILAGPMFHVSGLLGILMTGPAMGVKLVFPPPGRWDPTTHLELTVRHAVSVWSGVPTQYWRLLRHPDFDSYDLRSVRSVGSGGAPYPPELVRELKERVPWVVLGNGYGMSETVGLGTRIGGPLMEQFPSSVGPANPTVEVEIRDPFGVVVPEGEVGEIHLRTAATFLGYWNDEESTRRSIDDDGWYRTGDFGRVSGGMLYLESRMRDLILRGGENVYPIEIENRLVEHPDIDDAAVIGVDHAELGQEVKAFVVVRAGASMEATDVQAWAAGALAGFKVPAHVEFRDSLPYTESGKVLKQLLEVEPLADR